MGYNDYFDKFDTKDFELLAKNYAQKYSQKAPVQSLSINNFYEENSKQFFVAFEALLDLLFWYDKDRNNSKITYKNHQNIAQKISVNTHIKEYAKIYLECKKECYFSPFFSVINKDFDYEKELVFALKKLLFKMQYIENSNLKTRLIDNIFLTHKYVLLGYFR